MVHLGTNGYINEGQFKELLRELADCKSVIVINVHAARRWTASNNEIIERMTHEFANARLIDWNAASSDRPDYFVKDGIHLTRGGMLALAAQIKIATGISGSAPAHKAPVLELERMAELHEEVIALAQNGPAPKTASLTSPGMDEIVTEELALPFPNAAEVAPLK